MERLNQFKLIFHGIETNASLVHPLQSHFLNHAKLNEYDLHHFDNYQIPLKNYHHEFDNSAPPRVKLALPMLKKYD